jgi:DNA polymerase/3'-5' exonuclease PolX
MKTSKQLSSDLSRCSSDYSNPSRRGASESPEIDVLVTHPEVTNKPEDTDLLKSIIQKLQETEYITDDLTLDDARYEGIAQLPASAFSETPDRSPVHRRILFRVIPWDSFVFAQLHHTGSEAFIRHLREQAARIGYQLTPEKLEKRSKTAVEIFGVDGLRFMEQDKNDTRKEGDTVLLDSEEDIFRFLRMEFVHPRNRNWF